MNVGVIGGNKCSEKDYKVARELGRLIAVNGWILVCGGRQGVMEAACKGAKEKGGITIGILPGIDSEESNSYVDVKIPTGLGNARNVMVVRASDCLVAIDGKYGTLSEIAFALTEGKKVYGLNTWDIEGVEKADGAESVINRIRENVMPMNKRKAVIMLEDGFFQTADYFGAEGETLGEVVFNTSMSGYQEILTDPSYKGQIVCMTYPLIGNYGINSKDIESGWIQVKGFIVRERSRIISNWQAEKSLEDYLRDNNIIGIESVDTRAITRHIRMKGAMKGIISANEFNKENLKAKLDASVPIAGRDLVKEVLSKDVYEWDKDSPGCGDKTVVVIDCGVKFSILRNLKKHFKTVWVVPATISIAEILKLKPAGILFSNGPGDPEPVRYAINLAGEIIDRLKSGHINVAVMGICLGHQILGLAIGGKTYKLKFGHHGGNHPVKNLETGRIDITAQNHNFCLDTHSLPKQIKSTYINLYDKTSEGIEHRDLPVFSVQFHPEAGPGPFDAHYLFKKFEELAAG